MRIYWAKRDWKLKSLSKAISNQKMAESLLTPIYKAFDKLDFIFIASVIINY